MTIDRDNARALDAYDALIETEWGDARERVERDPMDAYKESLEDAREFRIELCKEVKP